MARPDRSRVRRGAAGPAFTVTPRAPLRGRGQSPGLCDRRSWGQKAARCSLEEKRDFTWLGQEIIPVDCSAF